MEADLKKRFAPELTEEKAGNYSPLVLAFTGDSVFETAVRTLLVLRGQRPVNVLNRMKNRYVKAHAQALMAEAVSGILTEKEAAVLRRGRNAKSGTMAKNATVTDYRYATGFEALVGYLHLTGQTERLLELIAKGIDAVEHGPGGSDE